jgi:serine/threonine protein kinase
MSKRLIPKPFRPESASFRLALHYEAEDLKLGRRVALKFLPEELASDPVALQRFEREARTASSMNHPNICTIYEVEEYEGRSCIVMELLQGQTLRDWLASPRAEQKGLPLKQILDVALQVADGLQAAHEKGIVHRDIKPANIFLTSSGQVKILDFGLAKLVHASESEQAAAMHAGPEGNVSGHDPSVGSGPAFSRAIAAPPNELSGFQAARPAEASLTRTGLAMGTAGYMSPEQVRGEKLDIRTDIFSFGLILYEMAAGQRAFSGETAEIVRDAILNQTPVPVHERKSAIQPKLEKIIDRTIEKDRELRYQSAAEMRADLESVGRQEERQVPRRWKLWTAAVLFVVALAAGSFYWHSQKTTHLTKEDTVVLADFANSTGDPVFDDALKTALTAGLRQSPMLNLLSDSKINETLKLMNRSSSERLTYEVAKEVCLRTNSKALLASSIANVGNRYRLELKAVDCHTGATLAGTQAEVGNRNEIVRILGEAATRLRAQLGESRPTLEKFNRPLDQAMSSSPEALEAFTRAGKAQLQSPAAALPYLKLAIELDPNFTAAYANLGVTYRNLGELSLASANLTRAYQLRDRMIERHRLAIQAHYYSDVTGELDKVIQTYNDTERSYPGFWANHNNLGEAFLKIGQYEKSAVEEHESLRLMPDTAQSYNNLMLDYIALGNLDESKALFAKARAHNVDGSDLRATRYVLAFLQGDNPSMQEQLAWAKGKPKIEDVLLSYQSDTEGYYGRLSKAREFSHRAVESARQSNSPETMASWRAKEALVEAETGNTTRAQQSVADVLARSPGQDAEVMAALTLALASEVNQAQQLVDKLALEFPLDTLIQGYWLPTIRAAIELNRGNAERAIEAVQVAATYELGSPSNSRSGRIGSMYPVYVRGLAHLQSGHGQNAAVEFQKMLDHPGIVGNFVIGALARLQLGRAQAMMGDKATARKSYQDFLTLWKDADPDIPIYKQAKAEYAKLR